MTGARRLRHVALLVAPLAILVGVVGLASARDVLVAGSDLRVYLGYADRLVSGSIPYLGFHLEYPPLALVAMTAPRLAWPFGSPDLQAYAWLFTISQGLVAVLGGWLVARVSPRPIEALAVWALLVLAACVSMAWRYDLWPAVLVLGAVVAVELGHPGAAGLALGAGIMTKLFPVVLVPILAARSIALRDGRGLARLLIGTLAVVGVVMAVSIWFAGGDALEWVAYQADRGLQVESTGAGFLMLLHATVGLPLSIENAFASLQVRSAGADALAAAAPFVELLLVAGVSVLALVRFRRDVARSGSVPLASLAAAGVAVLASLLVASKVFSVQYVVWFLPLVPLLAGRQRWLAVAIAGLSTLLYPLNYTSLWQLDPAITLLLNVRNGLLVVLLGWLAWSLVRPGAAAFPSRSDSRVRGGRPGPRDPSDQAGGCRDRKRQARSVEASATLCRSSVEGGAASVICPNCGTPEQDWPEVLRGLRVAADDRLPGMRDTEPAAECGSAVSARRPSRRGPARSPRRGPPRSANQSPSDDSSRSCSQTWSGSRPCRADRDPEETRDLLTRYFELCREVIARYGGNVEKFIGDAVMAVWGAPSAHEDDAERAVRAGLELVDAFDRSVPRSWPGPGC